MSVPYFKNQSDAHLRAEPKHCFQFILQWLYSGVVAQEIKMIVLLLVMLPVGCLGQEALATRRRSQEIKTIDQFLFHEPCKNPSSSRVLDLGNASWDHWAL